MRTLARIVLASIFLAGLFAGSLATHPHSRQFRDASNAPPSRQFLLGTDELGRDRWSRLLYGSRVSLLLAPAAALFATGLAGLTGGAAGYIGGWTERAFLRSADMFLSLPWIFLFLAARAMLPLNAPPVASAAITFGLLGALGWAGPARVAWAGARELRRSDFVLQAKACGRGAWRLLWVEILPNLRPALTAQFWVSVPVFILSEANLGLLGLGVPEPLPSWGNLLRELENYQAIAERPWMLAPAAALLLVIGCLHVALPKTEEKI